jgi:hypothetical protein
VGNALISLLFVVSLSPSAATLSIERAFLQTDAGYLRQIMPRNGLISLTLAEPLSFSDQLSDQQTYFLLKEIFHAYTTLEFYPERESPPDQERTRIFNARWSFQDKKYNKYHLNLFFLLTETGSISGDSSGWKVMEIRAEKY